MRNVGRHRQHAIGRGRHCQLSVISKKPMSWQFPAISQLVTLKALAQDGLEQLPSIRAAVLKLNLGTQYIERLDGVGRRLLEFDSQNNPSPLDGIRLPNRVAYQQMFQAIARVASSPRAARDLMEAVVTQTSAAKDDGAGGAQ